MKTVSLIALSLVFLVGAIVLVSAYAGEGGVAVYKGWNLVYGFISPDQIQGLESSDIKAIYAFIPTTQKYVRLYPNAETDLEQLEDNGIIDDNEMLQVAYWVYSNKETGEDFNKLYNGVEYWLIDLPNQIEERPIYNGWNFVGITSEFIDKSVNEVSGNCDIQRAYFWSSAGQRWFEFSMSEKITEEYIAQGLVIKVSNDCRLGTPTGSGGITPPPEVPIDCSEDDGGKVVGVKGTTVGMNWQGEQVSKTDVCEEDLYENYLREYYCLDNVVQNEGNFCPDGTTCSNGACV